MGGVGYLPASGTFASLLTCLVLWPILASVGPVAQNVAALVGLALFSALNIALAPWAIREFGDKDPGSSCWMRGRDLPVYFIVAGQNRVGNGDQSDGRVSGISHLRHHQTATVPAIGTAAGGPGDIIGRSGRGGLREFGMPGFAEMGAEDLARIIYREAPRRSSPHGKEFNAKARSRDCASGVKLCDLGKATGRKKKCGVSAKVAKQ